MKLAHGGYRPRIAGRPARQVEEIALPDSLRISLMRRGLQYEPVVKNGQEVALGDALARAVVGGTALTLPSPASGTAMMDGEALETLVLEEVHAPGETGVLAKFEPERLTADAMRDSLSRAGLWPFFWSSAGGGMPPGDGSELPKAVIVNCVLAEPFRARGRVILSRSWDDVIRGIRFLPRILQEYGRVVVILTAVHDPVARRMYAELAGHAWVSLYPVPVSYPVDMPVILRQTLRRHVRSYGADDIIWSIDVQSVGALGACLGEGLPPHRRLVALGGPGVRNPRHLSVVVGTPLAEVIGSDCDPEDVLILRGGMFVGEPVDPAVDSVGYDDDAYFVLPRMKRRQFLSFLRPGFNRTSYMPAFTSRLTRAYDSHITDSIRGERRPCIACGLCEKVCPVRLLPQVLHRYLFREAFDDAEKAGLFLCVDCNLCTYVCPSKIELRKQFTEARELIHQEHEQARLAAQAGEETDQEET